MDIDQLIDESLKEDIGSGDVTTEALKNKDLLSTAILEAQQPITLFGLDIFCRVFERFDCGIKIERHCRDGERVTSQKKLATLRGKAATLLSCERVALNFIQHLSGVATATSHVVEKLKGTGVQLLDTRKTIPGWRVLQKQAVAAGGGINHRMGLFDRYMIKNNHIDLAGSISGAIEQVLKHRRDNKKIVVEVRSRKELEEALRFPIDMVLLDNFTTKNIREVLPLKREGVFFEVSGGITPENVVDFAIPGVDFLSIGALTHSAKAADIHLVIV